MSVTITSKPENGIHYSVNCIKDSASKIELQYLDGSIEKHFTNFNLAEYQLFKEAYNEAEQHSSFENLKDFFTFYIARNYAQKDMAESFNHMALREVMLININNNKENQAQKDQSNKTLLALAPAVQITFKNGEPITVLTNGFDNSQTSVLMDDLINKKFTAEEVDLYLKIDSIRKKANDLKNRAMEEKNAIKQDSLFKASTSASDLYLNSMNAFLKCHSAQHGTDAFLKENLTYDVMRELMLAEIKKARPVLEKHRGWKNFLCNLALAISIIGIPVAIANAAYAHATNRNVLFPTNSAKKLNELEKAVRKFSPANASA